MLEHITFGQKKRLRDGSEVEVRRKPKFQHVSPSDTALHELEHAYVAVKNGTGVKEISIIPEGNTLGYVIMDKADPIAGAAPHAHGRDGTGHDVEMVKESGMSLSSACSAAENIMRGKDKIIERLAGFVELKKKISGEEFLGALFMAEQGDEVEIIRTGKKSENRTTRTIPLQQDSLILSASELPMLS